MTRAPQETAFPVALFVAEAKYVALLDASARGCTLSVLDVDAALGVSGNRERLLAALVNLLQNALKFTHPHIVVTLSAHADGDYVLVDVKDHCGGLPPGAISRIFQPFAQASGNKRRVGTGAFHRATERRG